MPGGATEAGLMRIAAMHPLVATCGARPDLRPHVVEAADPE